jgi:hypothetical protein
MRSSLFVICLSLAAIRCSAPTNGLPAHCEAIEVDPSRELAIVDETVVNDPRFSFATVMGAVLAPNADARAWMESWAAMPGEESLATNVIDPWSNGGTTLDLARAPFELVAITNRVDFWTMGGDRVGELRFVYGLVTNGTRAPLTVIVELQLPPTRTPADWARAWHALGTLNGSAYTNALAQIAGDVLTQPLHGQVRTQDARISPARLAEFDIAPGAPLAVSNLVNTPSPSADPTVLASFVQTHEAEVLAGNEILPQSMLTPFATVTKPSLELPGVDAPTTQALLSATCSGCHTGKPTLDGTFHISPLRRGTDALSPFMTDSSHGASELDRRAEVMRGLLCQ